ncbi:MAG: hypothetical protein LBR40_04030 [Bacilli bacterium]|jgi:hypothetical protein|nr:hypothetical protein [Bacilli bacterium]
MKKANFTMSFAIEYSKVKPEMNKLTFPRIGIFTNIFLASFADNIE